MRKRFAKGRRHVPGRMNSLEAEYAEVLKRKGDPFGFEQIKLRLADKTYYTPDFWVMRPDDVLEFLEMKGGPWMDDARVKIKVAAEQYPHFAFRAIRKRPKKEGGGWVEETFGPRNLL